MPPELTKEEQLMVAVLIRQEEERTAFPGFEDAMALSVAPPPPLQPPRTPPARPRRGQDKALGRVAWSYACVAGGHVADPRLGYRDADSTARTSTAANGGLALAAGAIQRPLQR
jgi:hypothetical protein